MAVPSAKAADLGGDCCADLEERVAELEATTARKGNRKMSLTVYGQVNRVDPVLERRSSVEHLPSVSTTTTRRAASASWAAPRSARLGRLVTASWSIGVIRPVPRRSLRPQEEGGTRGQPEQTDVRNGDGFVRFRDVNFWLENKTAGRLTVGRITNSGQNGLIDLGGTSAGVGSDPGCDGGGFSLPPTRTRTCCAAGSHHGWSIWSCNCGGPIGIRMEGIKYTSPTVAGFIFDAIDRRGAEGRDVDG